MNHTEQWAKKAMKHVRVLVKRIGPRGATSDGERRAAEYVRDELAQARLRDVHLESFHGAVSGWWPLAVAFSLAAWGVLLGLLFDLVGGIIAFVLCFIASWIAYQELYPTADNRSVRRWLWRRDSQNVVGVIPSAGPVERRVVLMSYLDSARTPFFWRTRGRRHRVGRITPLLFLSLPLNGIMLLLGATTGNVLFYLIPVLFVFFQGAALFSCLFAERTPFTPGANNNASGVGTLLALAGRLGEAPLAGTEVWVLATGCRETGGDGIRAFLGTHGEALAGATFVALEGVGIGERVLYLTGEGVFRITCFSQQPLALAAQAAQRCQQMGLKVSAERHRRGPTEMGMIVRQGFPGISINAWPRDWSGIAGRRRVDDTLDTIQIETLAGVHTFAWTLLQEIDADLAQSSQ